MATKAELEAEVLRLKAELEDRPVPPEATEAPPEKNEASQDEDTWDSSLSEVLEALEEMPQKQPVLLALGALVVGYLIGRAR
ncbi:hypothetical protein BXY66_1631 [Shimia isoporae]|uniref:Uncharacterized protein n=1 Tax=Shimia isoporae TaxID=647720 RepID=A0A4R1NWA6_9RHOB|nr:hypothetical protein [Shimia isoporae]TCL09578.1 hypothetical protein BXY66_1631 [Shimia isoporae]